MIKHSTKRRRLLLSVGVLAGLLSLAAARPGIRTLAMQTTEDSIPAAGGSIRITPIMHASVQVEHAGKVIHVDPWSKGDYTKAKPADLILVTDIHGDHLDPAAIAKIRKTGTLIVAPAAAPPPS